LAASADFTRKGFEERDVDDIDSDQVAEIEITISPREEALASHGISDDEFSAALEEAIDVWERDDADAPDQPEVADRVIKIKGKSYCLGDLADVEVQVRDESADDEDGEEDETPH
jgi:hypothetical protein